MSEIINFKIYFHCPLKRPTDELKIEDIANLY